MAVTHKEENKTNSSVIGEMNWIGAACQEGERLDLPIPVLQP